MGMLVLQIGACPDGRPGLVHDVEQVMGGLDSDFAGQLGVIRIICVFKHSFYPLPRNM